MDESWYSCDEIAVHFDSANWEKVYRWVYPIGKFCKFKISEVNRRAGIDGDREDEGQENG